jgi:hypothetical protein
VAWAQGSASLEVTPGGVAPAGSTVTVKWSGPNGSGDYITVVRKGAPVNEYLNYQATSNGRTPVNPVSIVLPAEPGAYEIRYLFGNPRRVLAAVPYEVKAVEATVDGPASVTPGARFAVSWMGPNNGGDWVTIVASGAAPRAYASYVDARTGRIDSKTGSHTAELRAPAEPGRYELRYVQQGRVVIGTRAIEVAAGASAAAGAAGAAARGGVTDDKSAAGAAPPGAAASGAAAAAAPTAAGAAAGARAAGGAAPGVSAGIGVGASSGTAAGGAAAGVGAASSAASGAGVGASSGAAAGGAAAGVGAASGAAVGGATTGGPAAGSSSGAPQATVVPFIPPIQALPNMVPAPSSPAPSQPPLSKTPGTANSLPRTAGGGGLTAAPVTPAIGVTAATAVDPANFTATQTGDGTVRLTWSPVAGAGSYLLGGPGLNVGVTVNGTSHTISDIPPGTQTWTVATNYNPGGILTTSDKWSRATATVVNQSGRYRVVITGFRANNETYDDQLNFDGQHDEVYASASVTILDRRTDSVLQPRTVIKSATYGDSNQSSRIRAGSATAQGGIANGDVVPDGTDPRTASGSSPFPDRFPFKLWEGVLRDGVEAVVISPVLWEADGGQQHYIDWSSDTWFTRQQPTRVAATAAAIKDKATKADLNPFRGIYLFNCNSGTDLVRNCANGHDRPIGMNSDACIDGSGNNSLVSWCELTTVVTREAIEKLLASPYQVGGLGPGVIAVRLVEPLGINGNYDMFIRFERVP